MAPTNLGRSSLPHGNTHDDTTFLPYFPQDIKDLSAPATAPGSHHFYPPPPVREASNAWSPTSTPLNKLQQQDQLSASLDPVGDFLTNDTRDQSLNPVDQDNWHLNYDFTLFPDDRPGAHSNVDDSRIDPAHLYNSTIPSPVPIVGPQAIGPSNLNRNAPAAPYASVSAASYLPPA